MLITFSGLDGSGKTTLIRRLKTSLEARRHRVTVLAMYYHVGPYAFTRAIRDWLNSCFRKQSKPQNVASDAPSNSKGAGMPGARHGGLAKVILGVVRSSAVKRFVFFLDLVTFVLYRTYFEKIRKHTLIMDRYFYDSLADVADGHRWSYIRLFLLITPVPDVPIFVDVSPEEAFARKGEYPIEYMRRRRDTYGRIFGWVHNSVSIPNDDLEQAMGRIEDRVSECLRTKRND